MEQTTVLLPFSKEAGAELDAKFKSLLQTFAEKAKAERPKRWEALDYRLKGGEAGGGWRTSACYLAVYSACARSSA